jgi:hypothetical protein
MKLEYKAYDTTILKIHTHTHTQVTQVYFLSGGRDFTLNTAEMFSFGPNLTRAKKPGPLLLVYFMATPIT